MAPPIQPAVFFFMPPGRERAALRRKLKPIWNEAFGLTPAVKKPRRSTWAYGDWKAEALHQSRLAKRFLEAGRPEHARAARKKADEAEKQANSLK
jgi:hypothetical protein